jgi:hypothetical protein
MPAQLTNEQLKLLELLDPAAREKMIRDVLSGALVLAPGGAVPPAAPTTPATPPKRWFDWRTITAIIGALTVGGGATAGSLNWENWGQSVDKLLETLNLAQFLGFAAGVGFLIGFAYSIYHNDWKLVLPSFSKQNNTISLNSLGFLDASVVATVLAVLAAWSNWDSNGDKKMTKSTTLLIVSAAVLGARMRCGYEDRNLLKQVMPEVAGSQPKDTAALAGAKTIPQRVEALGFSVAGYSQKPTVPAPLPPPPAPPPTLTPSLTPLQQVAAYFDTNQLKAVITPEKPLTTAGEGLTLGMLSVFTVLRDDYKPFVQSIAVAKAGSVNLATFLDLVRGRGVSVEPVQEVLQAIHTQAQAAFAKLQSLPADTKMTADQL